MNDLIKKLEAAPVGSRELDCEIYGILMPEYIDWEYTGSDYPDEYWRGADGKREVCYVPRYTTSIDAALTLVPEGWRVDCCWEDAGGTWMFDLIARNKSGTTGQCRAPTPALALCIAAMRARTTT